MSDVGRWLVSLGLGQYAEAFQAGDIEWGVLPELDHEVLKDLGVSSPGHRLEILKAAKTLSTSEILPPTAVPAGGTKPEFSGQAERRQLTIMFADLVGSTEMSQRLDPEDLREVNRAYQDAASTAIDAYGGYVARYMGDGILAYFGYPRAHEDDPERAVRAGLKLIEDVSALETKARLAIRVGVATGEVVVGDLIGEGASQESAVVGETPNLAARLQGAAETNDLIVSERTYRLVSGFFECEALAHQAFKGFKEPLPSWRVVNERASVSRFEAQHLQRLTPLVGRDAELQLLNDRWERAKRAKGRG